MKVSIGDAITALGYTYMVGEIIYQDCFDGNYDVEFLDPSGGYHHWKSEFDGGHIIPKEMNSVEKIIEGMKLIKEGCSEIPIGAHNCGKSTCPFGWYCYREEIDPPEDWDIPTSCE